MTNCFKIRKWFVSLLSIGLRLNMIKLVRWIPSSVMHSHRDNVSCLRLEQLLDRFTIVRSVIRMHSSRSILSSRRHPFAMAVKPVSPRFKQQDASSIIRSGQFWPSDTREELDKRWQLEMSWFNKKIIWKVHIKMLMIRRCDLT